MKNIIEYKIIKKNHTDSSDSSDSSDIKPIQYDSIVNSNYKVPKGGTIQDNLTKEQIKQKLIGYKALKTNNSKKYLLTLPLFRTWIKYYNTKTNKFRTGGLLMKVDSDLKYIILVNTVKKLRWSVELSDNIIFVPNPKEVDQKELEKKEVEQKEKDIKEKLFKLYKTGKLKIV